MDTSQGTEVVDNAPPEVPQGTEDAAVADDGVKSEADAYAAIQAELTKIFDAPSETAEETAADAGGDEPAADVDTVAALDAVFNDLNAPAEGAKDETKPDAKPEAAHAQKKGETDDAYFKRLDAEWGPDIAAMARDQADLRRELAEMRAAKPANKGKEDAPHPIHAYLRDILPEKHTLASDANLGKLASVVVKAANPIFHALARVAKPTSEAAVKALENEAIRSVVLRIDPKIEFRTPGAKPAARKQAPVSIPPSGRSAGSAPSAQRPALTSDEQGQRAVAAALNGLG